MITWLWECHLLFLVCIKAPSSLEKIPIICWCLLLSKQLSHDVNIGDRNDTLQMDTRSDSWRMSSTKSLKDCEEECCLKHILGIHHPPTWTRFIYRNLLCVRVISANQTRKQKMQLLCVSGRWVDNQADHFESSLAWWHKQSF